MYAISLTSIPPRYPHLGPVLASLLAQRPAPARVILALPDVPARFAAAPPPDTPDGVETWLLPRDEGPATKALPAARALTGHIDRLIYCDDDWLMPPGWAAALLDATTDRHAAAASGFGLDRLKRHGHRAPAPGLTDIAQGFAGVCIRPEWLAGPGCIPPPAAWPVDDIWLSAQLARQGVSIRLAPAARTGMRHAFDDAHALQDAVIDGRDRPTANRACMDEITARYGLWPPAP
ncbi:hypothetical protein [Roseovarius nitratireducens]|uniref:hypothetical protein n=1 Tax=Roseovarius nitratireducens TaxID=2044597 RepID=UPI000CE1FF56|nr:hypothetical protein [Roseovarius nitratireducens]